MPPQTELLLDMTCYSVKESFNGTLLIGPDPLCKTFDYGVFMEARRRLRLTGMQMTNSRRGIEEYARDFNFRVQVVKSASSPCAWSQLWEELQELWRMLLCMKISYT